MTDTPYIVLFTVVIMAVLCGFEDRRALAPLGLSAATIVAVGEPVLGRWRLGLAALGFATVASRRWYIRRGRDDHV